MFFFIEWKIGGEKTMGRKQEIHVRSTEIKNNERKKNKYKILDDLFLQNEIAFFIPCVCFEKCLC